MLTIETRAVLRYQDHFLTLAEHYITTEEFSETLGRIRKYLEIGYPDHISGGKTGIVQYRQSLLRL